MKICVLDVAVSGVRAAVRGAVFALALLLAACAVGPDYQRPDVDVGQHYKEAQGWTVARPGDAELRGDWWNTYNDSVLDGLMDTLLHSNLSIAQSEARYREAKALVGTARSAYFPVVGANASATRSGSGDLGNRNTFSSGSGNTSNQYTLSGSVSWEPDLWGRIRREVESSRAELAASAADIASTRLSMESTLAQTYFQLRAVDAQTRLLDQTVTAYERSLLLTQSRYQAGVAAKADVAAARTQLENTRAQLIALHSQRAQYEHAIAVLLGEAPSKLSLGPTPTIGTVPVIPVALPSQLLERRPDVAAAERRTAEANANIGVAQAAWFPDLTLSAQAGYSSGQWAQWLTAPANFWSLGPALALTIFDAGARRSKVEQMRAAYDAQVATYRLTVLTALREVEDYLVQLHVLAQQQAAQDIALASARESLSLTQNQYEAGLIDYLGVVQVQATALSTEGAAITLTANRLVASVQLIAALGGGWHYK